MLDVDDRLDLWEHAPCAIHSADSDGVIRQVNSTWLRWLGYARDEVEGKLHFLDILTLESKAAFHRRFLGVLARGRLDEAEFTLQRKDGSTFAALVSASIAYDEAGRFVRSRFGFIDISERKRGEEYMRRLIDAAPDATITVLQDGTIAYANLQTERLFGYSRNQLVGQPVEMLMPAALRAAHVGHREQYMKTPQVRPMGVALDLYGRRRDGTEFPIEISLSPIDTGDAPLVAASIRDISERRQAELATSRLAAIVDSSQDAILSKNLAGVITSWNRAAERLFGYTAAEAIGHTLSERIPDDHRDEEQRVLERLHRGEDAGHFETVRRRKDGAMVDVNLTLSLIRDRGGAIVGTSTVARDIGPRKRAEAAVRLASDRLAEAIECIDDALAIFDHAGRLQLDNSAHRSLLLGVVDGPVIGLHIRELAAAWSQAWGSSAAAADRWIDDTFRDDRPPRMVHELELGGRTYHETSRRTRDGGFVVLFSDRTEEHQREEALRKASTAKSEFLSSMSHELRTPLNAVLGFAQLLQRDRRAPLTPRQLGMVEHIVKGGEHLLRLIDDILDLTRIEAGRVPISLEPVDLIGVVEEALSTLAPLAARAEVELAFEVEGELPRVLADRTRLAQIVMNFGSNAIKYSLRGGRAVFVASSPDPRRGRLTVTDRGIGIPLAEQDKIFQPFHRAGQETGPIEGTGIGLAITRRLAELMNGTVGFHSAPGAGSQFWVDLPAADEAPAATATQRRAAGDSLASAGDQRIVYIEDHPANIAFMQELMADVARIELLTAPTAEIGLEMVRTHRPHAVILDINLPGMNGIEALRRLREWPETRDIPVIALSAAAMDHDIRRARDAGFFRYLTKPVQVEALIAALREVLPA
jgi:PAS domain S-box-containing protein